MHDPKSITFYCGASVAPWGPSSLWTGIGGSEEALIHVSRCLAQCGWDVRVFATPPDGMPLESDGVHWFPHAAYAPEEPTNVFIAWRDVAFVQLPRNARIICHWLHNRWNCFYPSEASARVDRILLVSEYQLRDGWWGRDMDRKKLYQTSNGLDEAFLEPAGNNEPERVIYASCPARGLIFLLEAWPAIRRRVPGAWLDVYNGFTPIYDDMAKDFPGLNYIRVRVLQLLDQPGVTFHGMVGQDVLAKGFARAGVWAYPTDCAETSCITAMKALAMGCLPVTTGYAALSETLGGRDLGPVHPERPFSKSCWRQRRFAHCLVRAIENGSLPEWRAKRLEWSNWARQRYRWSAIAADWSALFERIELEREPSRVSTAEAAPAGYASAKQGVPS